MNTTNTNDEKATVFVPHFTTREGLQEYLLTVLKLEKNSPLFNRLMTAPIDMVPEMLVNAFNDRDEVGRIRGVDQETAKKNQDGESFQPGVNTKNDNFIDWPASRLRAAALADAKFAAVERIMPKGVEPPKRGSQLR